MPDNVTPALIPATVLAAKNIVSYPNESDDYRRARQALLVEEIELRRHIERVAELRRALPPGGEVTGDFRFEGEKGPVRFVDLTRVRIRAALPTSIRSRPSSIFCARGAVRIGTRSSITRRIQ
jgi:hypothetical protein